MKIFIMGLTPFAHNRGVSAMVSTTIREIKEEYPNCEIVIWGGFPEPDLPIPTSMEYRKYKSSIQYIKSKWDLSFYRQLFWMPIRILSIFGWKKDLVIRELMESDLVLSFNYGDIFSDVHSFYNIGTILRNILPILGRKRIIFAPQTIGPFKRKSFEIIARWILNNPHVGVIMPRDPMSYKWLKSNIHNKGKIIFCQDMAFLLKPAKIPSIIVRDILDTGYISICLNPYQVPSHSYKKTVKILGDVLDNLVNQTDKYIVFIPHATAEGFDCRDMAEDIKKYVSQKDKLIIIKKDIYTTEELKAIIANSDALISFLTHPIIAALSSGVPVIGISSKSPKMLPIMSMFDMDDYVIFLDSLIKNPNILKSKLKDIISTDTREKLSTKLKNKQQIIELEVKKKFREAIKNANS